MVYFEITEGDQEFPEAVSFNPCSNGWCTSRVDGLSGCHIAPGVSILVLMDGVLRGEETGTQPRRIAVSILVLMDGVLRALRVYFSSPPQKVSILVLMDGVLREDEMIRKAETMIEVSILVLMDGVLRVPSFFSTTFQSSGFNPCSNGWCTSRITIDGEERHPEVFQSLF